MLHADDENKEAKKVPYKLDFNALNVVGCAIASVNAVLYLVFNHWATNNLYAIAFSIQAIEMIDLGSFFNGAVLLVSFPAYSCSSFFLGRLCQLFDILCFECYPTLLLSSLS